jgi:hypothetical protein
MHIMCLQRIVAACAGQRQPATAAQVEHHGPPATRCCCHGCAFAVALVAATWYAQEPVHVQANTCASIVMLTFSLLLSNNSVIRSQAVWLPMILTSQHDGTYMPAAFLLPARFCCIKANSSMCISLPDTVSYICTNLPTHPPLMPWMMSRMGAVGGAAPGLSDPCHQSSPRVPPSSVMMCCRV